VSRGAEGGVEYPGTAVLLRRDVTLNDIRHGRTLKSCYKRRILTRRTGAIFNAGLPGNAQQTQFITQSPPPPAVGGMFHVGFVH